MKRGRKTLCVPLMQGKICKLLAQGHTISTVCEAVGIGERTYFDWCEKNSHFSQAASRAISQSKIVLVKKLMASKDWRAWAFLLERRWPHEYGRTERKLEESKPTPSTGLTIVYDTGGKSMAELLNFPMDKGVLDNVPPFTATLPPGESAPSPSGKVLADDSPKQTNPAIGGRIKPHWKEKKNGSK